MAITSVTESWQGQRGEEGIDSADRTRVYTVEFDGDDDPIQRPRLAYTANDGTTRSPNRYETLPNSPWYYVHHKAIRCLGPCLYEVTVYYTVRFARGSEDKYDPTVSPLAQPWDVEWGFASSREAIDRDVYGHPIVNSAGESFDPAITTEVRDLVLRIVRNQGAYDPILAHDYVSRSAVNLDEFWGFAPGIVKCLKIKANSQRTGDLWFWRVRYEFAMRADGWLRRILDQGFREFTGTDANGKPTYELITDDNGYPVTQPVLLDGNGNKQAEAADAVFLEHQVHPGKQFSLLGL